MAGDSRGSGGMKKHGRNAMKCKKYRGRGRREWNKDRKAEKRAKKVAHFEERRPHREDAERLRKETAHLRKLAKLRRANET